MANPNYCTLAEARATAKRITIAGGVKAIYLPALAVGSPVDVISDPQDPERKQYQYIMGNGNAEQSAGVWTYYLNRWWCKMIPDSIICWWYEGDAPEGNGKPPVAVAWKEAFRG